MTFRQFTFNNVFRNKRLYAAFFLSSMFSVLVFFVYAIFAFHPALSSEKLNSAVASGLYTAEGIVYVFAIFFVLYSMSAFLKSRKKEFGLLVMHGMSTFQLRLMIFMENLLIGLFSTLGGIGLGMVFAKAILMAAERGLRLDQSLRFYWPVKAILLTFGAFMLLFGVISLFTVIMIRGKKIIELIKGNSAPKADPRASLLLSLLAVLLLGGGYGAALWAKGLVVVAVFVPVTVVVIIGTYFLFRQLSVYAINGMKKSRRFFWRRTNMLMLTDLAYRMKDNSRTFFIISIVSTVAFTTIGALICFGALLVRQVDESMPFEMQYRVSGESGDGEEGLAAIRGYLAENGVAHQELKAEFGYFGDGDAVISVPLSAYNGIAEQLGEEQFSVSGTEAIAITNNTAMLRMQTGDALQPVTVNGTAGSLTLQPVNSYDKGVLPFFRAYYIVGDETYRQLGAAASTDTYYFWSLSGSDDLLQIGKDINELLENRGGLSAASMFASKSHDRDVLLRSYNIVLFVGLFIGVIFFVAAGSFLYFRLYQDLDEDKRKFAMITKLGLTSGELSKVVTSQMLLLFFAPVAVALVHGAVALNALQNMFMQSMAREAAMVLGGFLLIQLIYFLFARFYYIRRIRQDVGV